MSEEMHQTVDDYAGPNRRRYNKSIEEVEVDLRRMFEEHERKEKAWVEKLRDDFLKAFPKQDLEGHCRAHEAQIKAKEAEEAFWQAAKSEAIKNGVAGLFAVLKIVAILAFVGLAFKLGVGPSVAKILGVTP